VACLLGFPSSPASPRRYLPPARFWSALQPPVSMRLTPPSLHPRTQPSPALARVDPHSVSRLILSLRFARISASIDDLAIVTSPAPAVACVSLRNAYPPFAVVVVWCLLSWPCAGTDSRPQIRASHSPLSTPSWAELPVNLEGCGNFDPRLIRGCPCIKGGNTLPAELIQIACASLLTKE